MTLRPAFALLALLIAAAGVIYAISIRVAQGAAIDLSGYTCVGADQAMVTRDAPTLTTTGRIICTPGT